MKKLILLTTILVFWGCEEESDNTNIVGYTSTNSTLDPTVWEGTDNLDDDKLWKFNFWNINGNLMWKFMDTCDNSCGGSPYTLNTNVTPNEIDFVVNYGCMEDSYLGKTVKGIIEIQTETANGAISFSGLTIAISEPGSDSRPSSFSDADANRVWTLDYVDIDDIFYVDNFLVVDCDEDGELSDEAECGGENDSNVGVCGVSGCGDNDALYDPTGYRVYKTSETVYDSPTECSGSSQTNEVNSAFPTYYEFTADGVNSNDMSNPYKEYEYCISGSSLYIYWYTEVGFSGPMETGRTYTMTSDSTYHIQYEAACSYCCHETEEECNDNASFDAWNHCHITYWEGTSIE
tara:strand:- start:334 stop:1374 length:1041 start_codon:yes stop_codon:yes gene_type:complete